MKNNYTLTPELIKCAANFSEFANGGAQVTIELKDGRKIEKALISNSSEIIAIRGYKSLPFKISEISKIYQSEKI